jgi:putative GTP pyrophosphokinase
MAKKTSKVTLALIPRLVSHFEKNQEVFDTTVSTLTTSFLSDSSLKKHIHSLKGRVKDPEHLKKKLARKYLGEAIDENNLFTKITDLAGIRVIHLHTTQMDVITSDIERILDDLKYKIVEKVAYTWDDERKVYFKGLGFKIDSRETMYTSIHYILEVNRKTKARCEIQVRTLMEEVWGEVSHTINYPNETKSIACKEQLKALAKITAGGSRLVDAIFASQSESDDLRLKKTRKKKKSSKAVKTTSSQK